MALVIRGTEVRFHPDAMDEAFRLRHRVFVDELGWEALRRADGREIDGFDGEAAVHVLAHRAGTLAGYARLLPTLAPHVLSEVFPWLCDGRVPRGADTMEWTRQCVAPDFRGGSGVSDLHAELILAVLEWSLANGVRRLTAEGSPSWIARFRAIGMSADALGRAHLVEGVPVVAMRFGFEETVLPRARRAYGFPSPVLEEAVLVA